MNLKTAFTSWLKRGDLLFLLFLIGIANVKLQIKVVIVILYFIFWIFKKVPFKQWFIGPIKFYLLIPIIGIAGALWSGAFNVKEYWFGSLFGIVMWGVCALAFVLLNIAVAQIGQQKAKRSIEIFFLVNLLICFFELIKMSIASKHFFPYWYTELSSIYGVSSGDHLHGIFQDNSTVNAAISLLSSIYFLIHRKYKFAFINIVICLLCTSNLTFGLLVISLAAMFVFLQAQRKKLFYTGLITVLLYLVISPENFKYINRVVDKYNFSDDQAQNTAANDTNLVNEFGDSAYIETQNIDYRLVKNIGNHPSISVANGFLMNEILKDFSKPIEDNLGSNSLYLNERKPEDLNALQNVMSKWYGEPFNQFPIFETSKVGKMVYLDNAFHFVLSKPNLFLFGAGMGNYSSKLALKMTGFKLQGTYPQKFRYIGKNYFENTFYVHMFYWAKSLQTRSNVNYPGSIYMQLLGEYGIVGLCVFLLFYIGYYFRFALEKGKKKLPLIFVVLMLFFFDYWFEMITLTVFFELFMIIEFDNKDLIENDKATV